MLQLVRCDGNDGVFALGCWRICIQPCSLHISRSRALSDSLMQLNIGARRVCYVVDIFSEQNAAQGISTVTRCWGQRRAGLELMSQASSFAIS